MKLTICTLQWKDDHAVGSIEDKDGGSVQGSIYCRVYLDGKELESAISASVSYSSGFTEATLVVSPATVEIVEMDARQWQELGPPGQPYGPDGAPPDYGSGRGERGVTPPADQ